MYGKARGAAHCTIVYGHKEKPEKECIVVLSIGTFYISEEECNVVLSMSALKKPKEERNRMLFIGVSEKTEKDCITVPSI